MTSERLTPIPLSTEAGARERRLFILCLGFANAAFLLLDARSPASAPAVVVAARVALSVLLVVPALVLGAVKDDRVARWSVRVLAAGTAAAFGALVWGSGGTAGPYFGFYGLVPIVFTVAVPDDVPATALSGAIVTLVGTLLVLGEGGGSTRLAFTVLAYASSSSYALAGTVLYARMRRREAQARERELRAHDQALESQKMEAVGRLASGIAHDFNNMLVVILANARFLVDELPKGDARRRDAEEIRETGERAAHLVRQLLAFARRDRPQPLVTDVGSVVRGIETFLRRTIGEDVSLTVSCPPDPWRVRIDPGQLEQVLINLCVNARDAMPEGGDLRLTTRNASVAVPPPACEGLRPGRYALLSVEDTGCGMAPEVRARIFEPFFTTKERGKGTGLGLSTVYGIVERTGGHVAVTSEPGRGTRFDLYFPVFEGVEPAEPAEPPEAAPPGRGETVLLVEDEEQVREVARRMLARNGFAVVEARDGAEALGRLEAGAPVDVVLSDVVMPGFSAGQLTAVLRERWPGIPLLLMSGYPDRLDDAAASATLLRKPFTEGQLVSAIRSALDHRGRAPPA
jgi:signal transduction histidine kinase/CheY-like chemotaxis protein